MAASAAQNTTFDSHAIEQITNYLGIDTLDEKQEIVNDLLMNGRSVLRKYEQFLPPEIFSQEINDDSETPLLQLIKDKLKIFWEPSLQGYPNALSFVNAVKSDNPDHFRRVLQATAESGRTLTPIVFAVLQLLFHTLDPVTDKDTLREIFHSLKNEGVHSLRKFADYISEDELEEQLIIQESPLVQALLMYNKEQVPTLLKKNKIPNTKDLYNVAAKSVTTSGLLKGIETVRSKITPILYKPLIESLGSTSSASLRQPPSAACGAGRIGKYVRNLKTQEIFIV